MIDSSFTAAAAAATGALVAVFLLEGCQACRSTELQDSRPPWRESLPPQDSAESDAIPSESPTDSEPDSEPPTVEDLDPWVQPAVWLEPDGVQPGEVATLRYQGDLADAERLVLRYGFDGWFELEGLEGWLGGVDDSSCPGWYHELELSPHAGGGFQGELELPPDVLVLDMKFVVPPESGGGLDDAEGLEYHHAFEFPYMGPWLTWNDQVTPQDGIVVSWQTSIPCLGVVSWGVDEPGNLSVGEERGYRHHLVLSDLQPDTRYRYRVHDCAGQVSETYSFSTADEDPDSLSFVVVADMQDRGQPTAAWREVAEQIRSGHPDADLLLMPGDLPCNDDPGHWWRFFQRGRELMAHHAVVPAVGNHDTPTIANHHDSSNFEAIFELPSGAGSEAWFTLDHGSSRFLILNSELVDQFGPDGAQYAWAQAELEAVDDDAAWVFASLHEPIYNVGKRFFDDQGDYRPVSQLFEGRVDWVFAGHEHTYQRLLPLRYDALLAASGAYGRGEDQGVGYMVAPTAGNAIFDSAIVGDPEAQSWLAYPQPVQDSASVPNEFGYTVVTVQGEDICLETWGMGIPGALEDPEVVDSVCYSRGKED